jgi:hypothetical protein
MATVSFLTKYMQRHVRDKKTPRDLNGVWFIETLAPKLPNTETKTI